MHFTQPHQMSKEELCEINAVSEKLKTGAAQKLTLCSEGSSKERNCKHKMDGQKDRKQIREKRKKVLKRKQIECAGKSDGRACIAAILKE